MMIFFWAPVLTALILQGVDGIRWPKGRYALLKPVTGCPEGWEGRGCLLQDTVHANGSNTKSVLLHIDGLVSSSYVIRSFCVKTSTSNQESNWPIGQYCIYRKREEGILDGMTVGQIKMYHKAKSNKDTAIYVSYNDWIYHSISDTYQHLGLYFQCETSGNKKIPISLPITKPFYLLPYGSRDCQQVKWTVATSEWIRYHTNNYVSRSGQKHGTVPYHELGNRASKGITMYYCYYQSCNYTLTNTRGVFQSPGFPGKYPDGQLCSWRIMVPENHTLHVHFTHFSLGKNDKVTFFKNYDGGFHLKDTFQGHYNHPLIITARSDVQFVLQTNKEGHSTGFRAEFKTSETTSSTISTERNIGHTTTVSTTVPTQNNRTTNSTADPFHKSRVGECDGTNTTVLVVIPLICLIVVIAVFIIILYRWRSKKMKCQKCESSSAGNIQIRQRISTATINTTVGTDDDDGQMYQALSRDQQPEYQVPDNSKHNTDEPSMDSGYPEYNEVKNTNKNGPAVVLDVPDSNNGPTGDQMYQALNIETTHNHLYQSTTPATMVTRNPTYVNSVA